MAQRTPKVRLDVLLVERGLVETRARAQALILAGEVLVDGHPRTKAGEMIPADAPVVLRATLPYVSRGGLKLAHALDSFGIDVAGITALDVGACTGGFTDVLLQRGASRVYSIDVGYGQLDWRLRQDERVVVLERTNVRHLESLPDGALAECGVVDVSFISLRLVLPAMLRLMQPGSWVVALIKPQFEAGADQVGKGGIVRDPRVHRSVLRTVLAAASEIGLSTAGLTRSPVKGAEGNVEFLCWLRPGAPPADIEQLVDKVMEEEPGASGAGGLPPEKP